jgi:hypothetical protein
VIAKMYISRHCVLCKVLEPGVRAWFAQRGYTLQVFKVKKDGTAVQVNGTAREDAKHIPAIPALTIGPITLVGAGILSVLTSAEKGN